MKAVVVVRDDDAMVTLMDEDRVVAVSDVVPVRDLARDFLGIVDDLCAVQGCDRVAIDDIVLSDDMAESAITQRALRTMRSVLHGARTGSIG